MSQFGEINITGPLSAFGEVLTVQPTPIIQITATYGNTGHIETFNSGTGSDAAILSPFFQAESGTDAGGFGGISSRFASERVKA